MSVVQAIHIGRRRFYEHAASAFAFIISRIELLSSDHDDYGEASDGSSVRFRFGRSFGNGVVCRARFLLAGRRQPAS